MRRALALAAAPRAPRTSRTTIGRSGAAASVKRKLAGSTRSMGVDSRTTTRDSPPDRSTQAPRMRGGRGAPRGGEALIRPADGTAPRAARTPDSPAAASARIAASAMPRRVGTRILAMGASRRGAPAPAAHPALDPVEERHQEGDREEPAGGKREEQQRLPRHQPHAEDRAVAE